MIRAELRSDLPGVVPAGGPEGTLEWVARRGGVVGSMAARVGSDPRAEELVLTVVGTLRRWLAPDTWEGIVDELPFPLRAILHGPGLAGPPRAEGGWEELVRALAEQAQHPPERAAFYASAVLASLKAALPRGLVDAIGQELPRELGEAWATAR